MYKKIILLLLICCISFAGFAQKNKRKAVVKATKNSYFEMRIDGKAVPNDKVRVCPDSTVVFTFIQTDTAVADYSFTWRIPSLGFYNTDTVAVKYPYFEIPFEYQMYLFLEIKAFKKPFDTIPVPVRDTLVASIKIDYIRKELDTMVCRGRAITVPISKPPWSITYSGDETKDFPENKLTPYDTLYSVSSGCDSLVCWRIKVNPYIEKIHSLSSCDSVIWGERVFKRSDYKGEWPWPVDSIFYNLDPTDYCCDCDTLRIINMTIFDSINPPALAIKFDQNDFCKSDDMGGKIDLETDFTAFRWIYRDIDTTLFEKTLEIEFPGKYIVIASMDTSLCDTLANLRIVNNCDKTAEIEVEDCPLIFPDVFTPNGDGKNDVFGIKKLNLERENELTIYDRWGKVVFQQKNYKCLFKGGKYENIEDAFIGNTMGGQKLPEETYYYAFKYDAIPKMKRYKGAFVILR